MNINNMRLIFATNNKHKLQEIKDIIIDIDKNLANKLFIGSDFGIHIEPKETGKTYIENANIKSKALYDELKKINVLKENDYIIADDTGLSIDFLDGAPGLYSARFMGEETEQSVKNLKILELMRDVEENKRTAYFNTTLSVIKYGQDVPMIFVGRIDGIIAREVCGTGGFGYDPIFMVYDEQSGTYKSFSQLGEDGKNKISHRSKAIKEFYEYIKGINN